MYDLNDAQPQMERGGVMPDGSHVKLVMHVRPGGASIPGLDPMDNGLLKQSNSSDVLMLDCEFTVVGGPNDKRKLWQNLTISGGKTDEKGQSKGWLVTKSMLRAVIESALGLDPDDLSDATKAKRVFQGFKQLDGIEFFARLGVQPGNERPDGGKYDDKNVIDRVLTVKDAEYAALRNGQEVAAKPRGAGRVVSGAATGAPAAQPAWAKPGAPAQAATPAQAKGPAWLNG